MLQKEGDVSVIKYYLFVHFGICRQQSSFRYTLVEANDLLPRVDDFNFVDPILTGQVALGVGSSPPKGNRLYFVILLKNVENNL